MKSETGLPDFDLARFLYAIRFSTSPGNARDQRVLFIARSTASLGQQSTLSLADFW
jgi:hypothetical protein